ncbi:MAG: DUF2330 domain-containing protein [Alphaproteobacteria bacterium]|nr:DUF2330 domain-containing protein [Alphaproteobacteria bacterium]
MLTSIALLTFATPDAQACGGFFCNNIEPVEQAGEAIVFEVDPVSNQTAMHVQVSYQGPPTEFAWIVPVSGTPDLFLSNDALFNTLGMMTQPRFNMWWDAVGQCDIWMWDAALDSNANGAPGVPQPPPSQGGGVTVLAQETVGPYDTVTVGATDTEALIDWLQANDYAVPDLLGPVLQPYIGEHRNFVALKLTSGADTGDLAPLGMRYDGVRPAIPVQLTSVAATPDMQLVTYVLGPNRAIPTNYLHVELNEAAVDWFNYGSNYRDVLSRAADEAGGHAFATDFAGPTDPMRGMLFQDSWNDLALEDSTGPADFISRVITSGIPASSTILEIFRAHIQIGAGYTDTQVFNCPDCYTTELAQWNPDFDALAAATEMNERVISPLYEIDRMFQRNDTLTRLGSTISPSEMTIDPEFGFNASMEQSVSAWHEARLVYQCDEDTWSDTWQVPKLLVLSDGTEIRIPSDEWLSEHGMTASEYLAGLQEPAAARIERTDETGLPVVIFDGSDIIDGFIDDHNNQTENLEGKGCGCSSAGGLAAGWLLAVVPIFVGRRRS